MNKKTISFSMLVFSLAIIPLVHLIAPLFFASAPEYVATGGGSIIGQNNVYVQLIPYLLAYVTAPVFLVWSLVRLFRNRDS